MSDRSCRRCDRRHLGIVVTSGQSFRFSRSGSLAKFAASRAPIVAARIVLRACPHRCPHYGLKANMTAHDGFQFPLPHIARAE
jgi:hypothetical protein